MSSFVSVREIYSSIELCYQRVYKVQGKENTVGITEIGVDTNVKAKKHEKIEKKRRYRKDAER